ncbi:MAG TPA: hypothetical protein VHD85_07980 [Terracidiphilus sp.]|nr:hypothetical protein [Terracidiphilus sp.]
MKKMTRREALAALPAFALLNASRRSAMAQLITGLSHVQPGAARIETKLELASSSTKLVDVFDWARSQAMAFVFDEGDPVGPWYEAVEPGREGFCIRDTCHQALGAHALGLARFNLNMLRKFAENVSDSKDWCSYWEINRYNQPAPVDYENDAAFWYNLPSNFDLVDCCFRMYVWTGDLTYINDPVFLHLYDRSVNDYVERWGLDIDHIMSRPRLLNVRGILDPKAKFPPARGIPGYNEGDHTYVIGFDVLATQHAAYLAYAHIQQARRNAAASEEFLKKAAAVEKLIRDTWWNSAGQCFYQREEADHHMEGCGGRRADNALSADWRADVSANAGGAAGAADHDAEVVRLLDLSHARLEYPEVSFSRVGDIVTQIMGVNLEYSSPLLSSVDGGWVEMTVRTLPGLGSTIDWAEVRNLPIRACTVTVRHDGTSKTTLTNQHGPALIWRPGFEGKHGSLLVNGKSVEATSETDEHGRAISSVRVAVGGGGAVTVSLPA